DCSAHDRSMFASDGTDDVGSQLGELSSFRCFEFGTTCEGPSDERQVGPRQNCVAEQSSPYMTDISSYVDFLKGLKSDPSKVIVAAITGGTDPVSVGIDPGPGQTAGQVWVDPQCVVCPGGGTDCFPNDLGNALVSAAPAIRMNTFLNAFPQRSTYQSICNYNPNTQKIDFSGALIQIAELLRSVIGSPCIEGRLAEPYECEVSDVQGINTENQVEDKIPSCEASGGSTPCWTFESDPTCETESNLKLVIDRGGGDPPPDTTVVARCLLE
ncbi:MAG TPA: hypothetical protein VKZ63_12195, partial [Kofleriaceae bacterium]|nr:hypothetical protein [Kofleriaceae bacterium]